VMNVSWPLSPGQILRGEENGVASSGKVVAKNLRGKVLSNFLKEILADLDTALLWIQATKIGYETEVLGRR